MDEELRLKRLRDLPKFTQSGGAVVKNLPANAGDSTYMGSIPGSGRSPAEGRGNPLQYLSWRIPWTEEPGGLQSIGSQRVGYD